MITLSADGVWKVADRTITASSEIVQLGLLNFQVQTAELALEAIREMTREKRSVSGLTMGISRKTYDLRLITSLADYAALDTDGVEVRSCDTGDIGTLARYDRLPGFICTCSSRIASIRSQARPSP
jgi:hypothetical protein